MYAFPNKFKLQNTKIGTLIPVVQAAGQILLCPKSMTQKVPTLSKLPKKPSLNDKMQPGVLVAKKPKKLVQSTLSFVKKPTVVQKAAELLSDQQEAVPFY